MKKKRTLVKILIAFVVALLALIIGYFGYVIFSYSRIPDKQQLSIDEGAKLDAVSLDEEYTIVTQNLGFGAYTRDFTFFMDGGEKSWAESSDSVKECISKGADTVASFDPDFILFQEVDLDSTRSHHINQYDILSDKFTDYSGVKAINYDSAFLMYPLTEPHGKAYSSMATFSRFEITSSMRRSLPISTSFSKFLDLDRCYTVSRIKVENGRELVVYNIHSSAYGGSDEIRTAQMTMLMNDMKAEYEKGNYVICGGDFNHDFTGDSTQKLNVNSENSDFGWAQPFPTELIPDGLSRAVSYKDDEINPTCRNCDVPYTEGNFTVIVDGFIISDNVECIEVENIVTGFEYSDHNPVVLKFKLKA